MVYVVVLACDFLSKIPDAENTIETLPASRIERAEWCFPVDQIAKAAGECATIWSVIVQNFWRALVLSHTNVAVVRSDCDYAVVSDLMNVLSRRKHSRINFSPSLGIVRLIASVVKGRKAKFVFNPLPEIARAVWLL